MRVTDVGERMSTEPAAVALPLFPLGTVLFPGGLLELKVFEARYLDLIATCLRERRGFGVVALVEGREARSSTEPSQDAVRFESTGTRAELLEVDSKRQGILLVRCRGAQRFRVEASHQQADGLWVAQVHSVPDDEALAPEAALADTVRELANAIAALKAENVEPFLEPHRFDDAGWVANRWCEILPIPQAAKVKLLELPDPMLRLRLVDDFLRSKGVVT